MHRTERGVSPRRELSMLNISRVISIPFPLLPGHGQETTTYVTYYTGIRRVPRQLEFAGQAMSESKSHARVYQGFIIQA